jgi:dihydroorotase
MDIVVCGGRVIDPHQGLDSLLDVGIDKGKVVSLSKEIKRTAGKTFIDARGCLVLPGLIDLHTHIFDGGGPWSIDPDRLGTLSGVTTMVDAGSAGAGNFHGFYNHVIKRSKVNIKAFLHIAFNGIEGGAIYAPEDLVIAGELDDIRRAMVRPAVDVARSYKNVICGIKVRASVEAAGANGLIAIDLAKQAAEQLGLPVMVHVGTPPPTRREILKQLRPGDILTHAFRGEPNGPCRLDGSVMEEMLDARERGVLFDIGHGQGSFAFSSGRKLIEAGFLPDTISTDVHTYSIGKLGLDLPKVMTRFLAIGMDLTDVVQATTANPAQLLGEPDILGSLQIGHTGDVSVFKLEEKEVLLEDAFGEVTKADKTLVPVATIRNGEVLWTKLPIE